PPAARSGEAARLRLYALRRRSDLFRRPPRRGGPASQERARHHRRGGIAGTPAQDARDAPRQPPGGDGRGGQRAGYGVTEGASTTASHAAQRGAARLGEPESTAAP